MPREASQPRKPGSTESPGSERFDVQYYLDLALSGKRRKVHLGLRPKRTKLPAALSWS
jgi:hypothetical protein